MVGMRFVCVCLYIYIYMQISRNFVQKNQGREMGDSAWFRPTRHMKQEVDKPGYNPENRNSTINLHNYKCQDTENYKLNIFLLFKALLPFQNELLSDNQILICYDHSFFRCVSNHKVWQTGLFMVLIPIYHHTVSHSRKLITFSFLYSK